MIKRIFYIRRHKMTSEISREEFDVEFRRLEGEWEVLKKEAGIKEYNKRKFITRKKEEEIEAEELELKARKIVERWNDLKRKAGIDIAYDIQLESKAKENQEINNTTYSNARPSHRKIQKIINIKNLCYIYCPFTIIPVIIAIQLNMLYQINKKYNVKTGIKIFIGNVIATVGILLFLQTISPQLTNLIHFPGKYIFAIIVAIVVKLIGSAYLETLKNILDN